MKKAMFLFVFAPFAQGAFAQSIGPSIINSTGGSNTIAGNTYEYSIGEMTLVNTFAAGSLVVTQGVLQPNENSAAVASQLMTDRQMKVYPVPTATMVTIEPNFQSSGMLVYRLQDISGKTILSTATQLVSGNEKQQINLAPYASGDYILNITFESKANSAIQSFKLQKLN